MITDYFNTQKKIITTKKPGLKTKPKKEKHYVQTILKPFGDRQVFKLRSTVEGWLV